MPLSTGLAILAVFLLVVGLSAVHLEIRNVQTGVRIRELLEAEEAAVERLRRLQMEHHARVSPDVLERTLPAEYRTPAGYPDDGRPGFPLPEPEGELEADGE